MAIVITILIGAILTAALPFIDDILKSINSITDPYREINNITRTLFAN